MGHELAVGGKAADCQPMWVTVWVRQLTHTVTHTIFSVFATKKHRKPKFSMLFGAGGVTRTHDLLITNQLLYRLSYISIFTFGVADLILTNQLLYVSIGNDEII